MCSHEDSGYNTYVKNSVSIYENSHRIWNPTRLGHTVAGWQHHKYNKEKKKTKMILKPGRLCTINNNVYRVKKATNGCRGCSLYNLFTCPALNDSKVIKPLECAINGVILERVTP